MAGVDHEDDPGLLADALVEYLDGVYAEKAEQLGEPVMKMLESQVDVYKRQIRCRTARRR